MTSPFRKPFSIHAGGWEREPTCGQLRRTKRFSPVVQAVEKVIVPKKYFHLALSLLGWFGFRVFYIFHVPGQELITVSHVPHHPTPYPPPHPRTPWFTDSLPVLNRDFITTSQEAIWTQEWWKRRKYFCNGSIFEAVKRAGLHMLWSFVQILWLCAFSHHPSIFDTCVSKINLDTFFLLTLSPFSEHFYDLT